MVLESVISPKAAENRPWSIFVVSAVYTLIASFFAYFLFPSEMSLLAISLITIIFIPFFQRLFVIEEKKDRLTGKNLFARHAEIIYVFSTFFLGVIAAMSLLFVLFPESALFNLQTQTLKNFGTIAIVQPGEFMQFLINNSQVMLLMFVLSLLFGAGAVFILAWNASIIAVYVGIFARSMAAAGTPAHISYILGVPAGLGSIALHGVPEIAAYFVAGLAGGILSVGMIREKLGTKNFYIVTKDSMLLLLSAELLIVAAALIEAL